MARAIKALSNPSLLTPARAAALRGRVAASMEEMVGQAHEVLDGTRKWSPTQARVFATLLNKVLPDLSSSHVVNENRNPKPEDMSLEELESLVANMMATAAQLEGESSDCIDGTIEGTPVILPARTPGQDDGEPEPQPDQRPE